MAQPCVRCGTTEGKIRPGHGAPARYGTGRFGMAGMVACSSCYYALDKISRIQPCEACGTAGGGSIGHSGIPGRFHVKTGSGHVLMCLECRKTFRRRQRLEQIEPRMNKDRQREHASRAGSADRAAAIQGAQRIGQPLPILNPLFTIDDLTSRAAARLFIRTWGPAFRDRFWLRPLKVQSHTQTREVATC